MAEVHFPTQVLKSLNYPDVFKLTTACIKALKLGTPIKCCSLNKANAKRLQNCWIYIEKKLH